MGYMKVKKDGTGINGSNSKIPILEVGEGERISYISDMYISRELPIYVYVRRHGCESKIHTWKNPFNGGGYCSSFTVIGNKPEIVNKLIKESEYFLGAKDLFPSKNMAKLNSFKERISWLFTGQF